MYVKIKEKRAIRVVDLPAELTKSLLPADVEAATANMLSGRPKTAARFGIMRRRLRTAHRPGCFIARLKYASMYVCYVRMYDVYVSKRPLPQPSCYSQPE